MPGLAPKHGADSNLETGMDGSAKAGQRIGSFLRAGFAGGNTVSPFMRPGMGDGHSGQRSQRNGQIFEDGNPVDIGQDRALSYGMGRLNSAGEAWLSGLVDKDRARLPAWVCRLRKQNHSGIPDQEAGRIEYLGPVTGQVNTFSFRANDGFGNPWAGQTVYSRADGAHVVSSSCVTDRDSRFAVQLLSALSGPVLLHLLAGENEQRFTINVVANIKLKMNASHGATTGANAAGQICLHP